ncbi:MAG: hypothetical protein P8X55_11900 [Desulfosarcinaceae bacterium]
MNIRIADRRMAFHAPYVRKVFFLEGQKAMGQVLCEDFFSAQLLVPDQVGVAFDAVHVLRINVRGRGLKRTLGCHVVRVMTILARYFIPKLFKMMAQLERISDMLEIRGMAFQTIRILFFLEGVGHHAEAVLAVLSRMALHTGHFPMNAPGIVFLRYEQFTPLTLFRGRLQTGLAVASQTIGVIRLRHCLGKGAAAMPRRHQNPQADPCDDSLHNPCPQICAFGKRGRKGCSFHFFVFEQMA